MLIALNRIWAVVYPLSYRTYHTLRTAVFTCLAMWLYVHLAAAPEWALDALYYCLPIITNGCLVNMSVFGTYDFVSEILFFNLPHLVMLISLPIVVVTRLSRQRQGIRGRNVVVPVGGLTIRRDALTPTETIPNIAVILSQQPQTLTTPTVKAVYKRKSYGFFLLILLTCSVTMCWTPIDLWYIFKSQNPRLDSPLFFQVSEILFSIQTTMDPIVFALALLPPYQDLFVQRFCRKFCLANKVR